MDPEIANAELTTSMKSHKEARKGRKVDKLVTDYLSAIGSHLRYILREKLGETVLRSMPLEFVLTVPAIWSDLAKQKTKKENNNYQDQ